MRQPFGVVVAGIALTALACVGATSGPTDGGPTPIDDGGLAPKPPPQAIADAGADGAADAAGLAPLPVREFQERDFSETEQSRDPFRSFASLFVTQAVSKVVVQRKVLVEQYALDELKLVGIVTRTQPRALLTDPSGAGVIAKIGDFVGKAEIIHAGGPTGTDVALNWRIDRIRDGNVVFVREDPSHPEIPPTTRVISLRTPEEDAALKAPRRKR